MTAGERITFALPLRGDRDILAARLNLFPSIDRFFAVDDVEEIMVIVRPEECARLSFADIVSPRLDGRIRIYDENDFLPRDGLLLPLSGYNRQQVVKITASSAVRTRLYCTLDSDVYLVRSCRLADWLFDGKCIYNPCSMDTHLGWWRASAKELGYELDFDRTRAFDVTPALLYADIVRGLSRYLETERKGVCHAIRSRATEYCLYWLYLLNNHRRFELYHDGPPYLYGRCLWTRADAEPDGVFALIDRQFEPDGFYFSILQSTSGYAERETLEYIHAKIMQGESGNHRSGM